MYHITVTSHFAGAHRLRYLHGKCEGLHGHNWKVEVSVASKRLNKEGVVLDFKILKKKMEEVLSHLDHSYLNDLPYFSKREPSSENIARYVFKRMKEEIRGYSATLQKVSVWETETACATYFGRQG
jgi:6-pyruvoyltetrahydropterin/6-carboxytetrahydropterin synthase